MDLKRPCMDAVNGRTLQYTLKYTSYQNGNCSLDKYLQEKNESFSIYAFLLTPLSLTQHTPIVIQLCLRSQTGLREKYYYVPFDIMHNFSSDVGFINVAVWSTG